jgi:hypothetical protein
MIVFVAGARSRLFAATAVAATALGATACPAIQAAEERDDCDQALEITRGCNTAGSANDPTPATIEMLQRCDHDDVYAPGYSISHCIMRSRSYCTVARALASSDESLCRVACDERALCDLVDDCHRFQYANCDVPRIDAGGTSDEGGAER